MFIRSLLLLATGLLLTGPALSNTYSVGPSGGGCTFGTLADAVQAAEMSSNGPHLIKVRDITYSQPEIVISNPAADITIEGGYASCSAAASTPNASTVLVSNALHRHFNMYNADTFPRRNIRLKNLVLKNGQAISLGGGAIYAHGKLTLILENTKVQDNVAGNGGGILLLNGDADQADRTVLFMEADTEISGNVSFGNGGGILAQGNTEITLWDVSINDNKAFVNGGGIALIGASTIMSIGPRSWESVEIRANVAGSGVDSETNMVDDDKGYGGGIYSQQARIISGTANENRFMTSLVGNRANFGGAVAVEGDLIDPESGGSNAFTFAAFENTFVVGNIAEAHGGAFYIRDAVDLTLYNTAHKPCVIFGGAQMPCSLVLGNNAIDPYVSALSYSSGGGALFATVMYYTDPRAIFRVYRTAFISNEDSNGRAAVGYGDYFGGELHFERSIFSDNRAYGTDNTLLWGASRMLYSTVLDNEVSAIFRGNAAGATVNITGSIVWDPGTDLFPSTNVNVVHGGCMIAHDTSDLPSGAYLIDPQIGEAFRPALSSLAIDACDDAPHTAIADAYNLAPMDAGGISPSGGSGINDLGAVEVDVLFYDGFGFWPDE